jgi:hypothetical protein
MLGGTIDGLVDYTRDSVDLHGTLVPIQSINALFGPIPVIGTIFGGKKGVIGFTYRVVGRPGRPVLNVNILSGLAPGLLRKFLFEYPAASEGYVDNPQ